MTDPTGRTFVRWQATTIAQLGYVNNLLLGLATGGLGFFIHLLIGQSALIANARTYLVLAVSSLLLSVLLGLTCALVRLYDFRTTARIARSREREEPIERRSGLRSRTKALSSTTWTLLWLQISSFALGVVLLTVAVLSHVVAAA